MPQCGRLFYEDSIVETLEKVNEQIEELENAHDELNSELDRLKRIPPSDIDLDDFAESEIIKITDPDE